ncbi:MAG: hypothetical protein KJ709_06075 [Nanoarchaeota archaeon]|nr:hypothetical protein [Nanoarchaeota archaeon]
MEMKAEQPKPVLYIGQDDTGLVLSPDQVYSRTIKIGGREDPDNEYVYFGENTPLVMGDIRMRIAEKLGEGAGGTRENIFSLKQSQKVEDGEVEDLYRSDSAYRIDIMTVVAREYTVKPALEERIPHHMELVVSCLLSGAPENQYQMDERLNDIVDSIKGIPAVGNKFYHKGRPSP